MPMNKPVKPKVMAKPNPRPTKPVEKPKAPRGSKTNKQMGDMNQREGYNAMRGSNAPIGKSKQSKASAKTSTQKAVRTYQRAGGKGK